MYASGACAGWSISRNMHAQISVHVLVVETHPRAKEASVFG